GFDYFGARYYGSALGRFLTPDPAGLAAVDPGNPQSWNRYAYALNNPVTNTEPTGLIAVVPQGCVGTPNADPTTGDYYMCPEDGDQLPPFQQPWDPVGPGGTDGPGGVDTQTPTMKSPSGPVCVSAASIDAFLANTPLAGEGQDFYNAGERYDVNPALAVAIAGAESTFGKQVNSYWGLRNAWGWGNTPMTRAIAQGWTTWQQGIARVTYQLSDALYMGNPRSPLTTTSAIYGQWCGSGDCAGGLRTINSILGDLGVSPDSLRFKACSEGQQ
ncbi:MAG: RHS repeat-associated core domain-containing protein, partial [Terriglobales bacterium]